MQYTSPDVGAAGRCLAVVGTAQSTGLVAAFYQHSAAWQKRPFTVWFLHGCILCTMGLSCCLAGWVRRFFGWVCVCGMRVTVLYCSFARPCSLMAASSGWLILIDETLSSHRRGQLGHHAPYLQQAVLASYGCSGR